MPSTKEVQDAKIKAKKGEAVTVSGIPEKSATAKRADKKTKK
ncbi:MAG: hypothetical protein ABIP95_05285 [Pelobium sp.]